MLNAGAVKRIQMEKYVTIVNGSKITIQRDDYIEDGAYIEIVGTEITLYEIPQFGGEPIKIGNFTAIIEAIKHSKTLM